jgi:hypothetical protein
MWRCRGRKTASSASPSSSRRSTRTTTRWWRWRRPSGGCGREWIAITVDWPKYPDGTWWVDIEAGGVRQAVLWRHGFGFGVFFSTLADGGYGDKPDANYTDAAMAAARVATLLKDEASGVVRPKSKENADE